MAGGPGLVVMGRDSRSEGCGFTSRHQILDGYFSHTFVVKCYCLLGKTENKLKRGRGLAHLEKQSYQTEKLYFSILRLSAQYWVIQNRLT